MKSISKFLLSTIAVFSVCANVYAAGLNVSVDDKRIVTVTGETESESVYIKVENLSNDTDSRDGFRYFGKTETRDNGFTFSFYASDAGEYSIYVTDKTGSYTEQTTQTIDKPVMSIDGGGIAGRKINVVASLPNAGEGATGNLKISYPEDELTATSEPVTADGAECSDIVLGDGEISLTYTVTGENPKIYFAMGTAEGFTGDGVTVSVDEFTLKNRYNDSIECAYDAFKEIELVTAEDFNASITSIVNAVNNLMTPEAINAENYESVTGSVVNCDNLIAAAVAIGADKDADIPVDTLSKLTAVKAKIEEIKPVAEVLLKIISLSNLQDKYEYLKDKKEIFGINDRTFEIIDNSTVKEQILTDMFKTAAYTIEDVKKAVGSSAILNQLTVTDYTGVQTLLDDLEYLVGIDFPVMSANVRKMIEKRKFDTVQALKAAIDAAIEAEKRGSGGGGSSSGGTGGGGGGGGSTGGSVSSQISGGGKVQSSGSGSYQNTVTAPTQPQETETESVFSDMNEASWAEEYVNKLYEKEIISGDGDGRFRPNDSLSRAEFVKMLVVAAKLQKAESEMNFDDVQSDDWYYDYVLAAVSNGIVSGISENLFGAGNKLTRQDMVVLLYRTIGESDSETSLSFTDSEEIADYAKDAVSALSGMGVVSGFEDGTFRPFDEATRAMAAKVICVLLDGGMI